MMYSTGTYSTGLPLHLGEASVFDRIDINKLITTGGQIVGGLITKPPVTNIIQPPSPPPVSYSGLQQQASTNMTVVYVAIGAGVLLIGTVIALSMMRR